MNRKIEPQVSFNAKLPISLKTEFQALVERLDDSQSRVIRQLIRDYIAKHKTVEKR